jgi:hypothetical protein
MLEEKNISAELQRLAKIASEEDQFYLATLGLAQRFEREAKIFGATSEAAAIVCRDFIGPTSALVLSARSGVASQMTNLIRELDRLQGKATQLMLAATGPNWFEHHQPTQAFLAAELLKRNLETATEFIAASAKPKCHFRTQPSSRRNPC